MPNMNLEKYWESKIACFYITLRVHIFARIYFRESKKFAFREDLFSRIEVFQKFREDLFSRIQSFTNFRDDLFSRNRPYKVLKKMIDCVNYGD